ncbi:hypothetical protein LMG28614_02607 [Paraburkholderia ultramafica]|uniref:Uncharacterized protein n=1 Tax=Paraburkholderia ultramafica TaxID=1544867 RepID=A0A6S7CTY2_9BURK|nr:hypothetical protein LMG28614_02607 [Paraburkholderia ultramafica]
MPAKSTAQQMAAGMALSIPLPPETSTCNDGCHGPDGSLKTLAARQTARRFPRASVWAYFLQTK